MQSQSPKLKAYEKHSVLTERLPELRSIPRIDLVQAPTPLVQYEQLGQRIGYPDLWVKQENLTSSTYGGNKPRKLEYALGEALSRKCGSVVTIGGIGTNHGLATAIFSRQLVLACHLVLFEQPVTRHVQSSLCLMHRFGATLHYAPNYAAIAWRVSRLLAPTKLRLTDQPMAYIPGGGTSPVNIIGIVDAVFELREQIDALGLKPPVKLFCAVGTGGTLAGLILGCKLCKLPTRVMGVRVIDRFMANPYRIAFLANRALAVIKQRCKNVDLPLFLPRDVTIMEGYFGERYGAVTREGRNALALAAEYGIKLETTYTAKAFAAMIDSVKTISPQAGPIIFWNSFNSVDYTAQAETVDYRELPRTFHRFFSGSVEMVED
jgi:1-aminocyclopropane-1-carboxylate deaminase/D-cysteine desulfhydrase-like pyridoxal-dependent ACC family enzyme